jgi:hypothetical protein
MQGKGVIKFFAILLAVYAYTSYHLRGWHIK